MRLRPGLRPEPHWGAYSAPPDPLAGKGAPGIWPPVRVDPGKGRGGREVDEQGWGRGKLLAPDVRFYG